MAAGTAVRRSSILAVLIIVLLTTVGAVAQRQLAMRVEVTPLRAVDDGILTEVEVWIAPEDRVAVGTDAMVWLELSRQGARVLRRGWAVKVDDPSQPLRVEVALPEGKAVLRVDVKGAADRSEGVWWGEVEVAVAGAEAETETETEAVAETESVAEAETVAEAEAVAETVAETEAETVTGTVAEAETVAETVTVAGVVAETEIEPVTVAEPVAENVAKAEAVAEPVPVAAAPAPVVVDEPDLVDLGSVSGELTVAATRDGRPLNRLAARDLEVRSGRDALVVRKVRGAGEAPLRLGFAVDLTPEGAADLPWVGRMVAELARRGDDVGGAVFVRSRGRSVGDWLEPESELADMVVAADDAHDLTGLVTGSLAAFSEEIRGRVFLVLVSDGRSGRPGWKDALQAAQRAGVPVLVAGIWHADFGAGARKDLRKLAELSGGSVFYLQGPTQVEDLLDRFGTVIDGSWVLTVDAPPGTGDVVVSAADESVTVHASTAVR